MNVYRSKKKSGDDALNNIIVLYVVGLLWYLFVMYKIGSQMNDADLKNPSNETKKEK